MLLIMTF